MNKEVIISLENPKNCLCLFGQITCDKQRSPIENILRKLTRHASHNGQNHSRRAIKIVFLQHIRLQFFPQMRLNSLLDQVNFVQTIMTLVKCWDRRTMRKYKKNKKDKKKQLVASPWHYCTLCALIRWKLYSPRGERREPGHVSFLSKSGTHHSFIEMTISGDQVPKTKFISTSPCRNRNRVHYLKGLLNLNCRERES